MGDITMHLSPLSKTLLLPLVFRAMESRRPDALLHDPRAAEIAARLDFDLARVECRRFQPLGAMMRTREFDRTVRVFLGAYPDGVIVDLGCGLDARFERVDNGWMRWYNVDVPEVITLREQFFTPTDRCRQLPASVFDLSWMDEMDRDEAAYLFVAEGLFLYSTEDRVRRLVVAIHDRFPGAHLVFDAVPWWMVYCARVLARMRRGDGVIRWGPQVRWGIRDSHIIERWHPRAHLLRDWRYYHHNARRGRSFKLLGTLPGARDFRVLYYRLG